ncbi:MAG: universal stress protein [Candidatus Binatia bacterium]
MDPIGRILVPLDFSPSATFALDWAEEFARRLDAELVLLHVNQPGAVLPGSDLARNEDALARAELDRIAQALVARGRRARALVRPGSPSEEIVRLAAEERVGLIVMGTHGRSDVAHLLLGSVADRVVRRAACPVLTVRHPDRSTSARGA